MMHLPSVRVDFPDREPGHVFTCLLAMLVFTFTIGGLAVPAVGATPKQTGGWAELRQDDLRVATVMYKLAVANGRYCRGALAPQTGFALQGIDQYDPADREEAAKTFGLGAYVGVTAVVANSPAARAGLRANDQLVSVNGRALASSDTSVPTPTNGSVEAVRRSLLAEMQKGEVVLLVTGVGGDRIIQFSAEKGCRSAVELDPGSIVNASADGQHVMVSAGLLERCASDDDLAFVIAHELAHNLLHHAARLARAGISANGLLPASGIGTAEMRETEEEADRLGVRLALSAGYDLRGAPAFLNGLQMQDGLARSSSTHPAPERRLALLTAAIARGGGPASGARSEGIR